MFNRDSIVFLEKILKNIDEPTIFWLDAHPYSGIADTPLAQELNLLKSLKVPFTILIDDARILGKNKWTVTLFDIVTWARVNKPECNITFEDNGHAKGDIIVIEDLRIGR